MADDPNNTTARWLIFHQTLAWFRQRYPGATDKQAYEVLQLELIKTVCGVSEGVPIDKFRYPWKDQMIDLVVLIRNNYLTFEDIQWQKVECNLDWLERDWPLPALEAEAAPVPATDAALKPIELAATEPAPVELPAVLPASGNETTLPLPAPEAAPAPSTEVEVAGNSNSSESVELPSAVNRGGRPTDRERIKEEARRQLSAKDAKENVPRDLAVFCRDLRNWLRRQPNPKLNIKTGEVMSVDTIEEHVRDMFWEFWSRPENR